ncbi:MAG TPA: oligopeptide transporter, OPT family [Woeseiaceae bacterium]|nr:oligopeptide transporter, OPT family [Woeseiaceae bacterium]
MPNKLAPLPPPVVAPERNIVELSVKALILGAFLSMLLAAANAYIGLLVGLTVSASIPAAAASMGVLRMFRRSTILENNMVQTSASAGEALVAGIIFTIPALVMMKAWAGYEYGPMVAIAVLGGILGVAFTVPLRRALIVEARLAFPEGQATAEVLKTGGIERDRDHDTETSSDADTGFKWLLQAAGIGAVFKFAESGVGFLAGNVATSQAWLAGKYLFLGNINISPALIGVGYIVGLNIAMLVFIGGVIGTIIGVPLNWVFNHDTIMTTVGIDPATAWSQLDSSQWAALAGQSWQDCRRIGVGAMMIGGLWSLISLAKPLMDGMRSSMEAYRHAKGGGTALRTEFDTPMNYVFIVVLLSIIPLFLIFNFALADYPQRIMISAIMTVLMLVFGFIFSSVAGYMAGLVGSSNNPISGVTIATVIVSALILLQLMGNEGIAATLGPIAVLYLAGLICSAAAIAGDNMQDLKCGHVLGATPWRQQLFQIVGVIAAAIVIPLILQLLDNQYGIGRPSPNPNAIPNSVLAAPQAGLMQALAGGIFGAGIQWNYIYLGFALAVALIILDKIQEKRGSSFRFPVLAVAVGVYLPFGLSVPIFIGGVIAWLVKRRSAGLSEVDATRRAGLGMLVASGLITGEALMGVFVALLAGIGVALPLMTGFAPAAFLALIGFVAVAVYQYRVPMSSRQDADA